MYICVQTYTHTCAFAYVYIYVDGCKYKNNQVIVAQR